MPTRSARSILLAISVLALACGGVACGGGAAAAPSSAPGAALGVQSNAPRARVTLRLRPDGPLAFATSLRVRLASEMLGEPMSAELETLGVRRVLEQRDDGTLSMEEIDTQSRYVITMMGRTQTGPDVPSAPEARRYLLGERGRRIDVPAPPGVAPPASGLEAEMRGRLESALDPLVRALEFPEEEVAPGHEWGSEGRVPLADIDPTMQGEALYRMTQRLERFEGSDEQRIAVISFEGSIEGAGVSTAPAGAAPPMGGPQPPMGGPQPPQGGPMDSSAIGGQVRFHGFYTVAMSDGFARTAHADFDGEVRLGPGGLLVFPLRGELEWTAAAIDAALATTPTAEAPPPAAL